MTLTATREYLDDIMPDLVLTYQSPYYVCNRIGIHPARLLNILRLTGEYVVFGYIAGLGSVKTTYTL
jgi:aspartokinase-like uncharacterized kinase